MAVATQARWWPKERQGGAIGIGSVMSPVHSYVIRVSLAMNREAWDVQAPGLGPAAAPTIRDAVTLALTRHVHRLGQTDAHDAQVFVTLEIQPDQIDEVIAGVIP